MIRKIDCRVRLYRLDKNHWHLCSSGYLGPNPIEVGKRVWVGSISSRDGYRTTEVVDASNTQAIPDSVRFRTKSGSDYLVVPVHVDIDDSHTENISDS